MLDNRPAYGDDQYGNHVAVPMIPRKRTFIFEVIIQYHGPFTRAHETRARWRYDEPTGRFVLADKGHNYQK